jgi:hypothetical protein
MSTATSSSRNIYWLCPLYLFDCYSESAKLVEGIEIKRIPRAFAAYLSEEADSSFFRTYPNEVTWMASLPSQANTSGVSDINELMRIGWREMDRARDLLVDLIAALRLCHEGRVIAGPLIATEIRNSEQSFGGTIIWTLVSNIWFFQEEPKYAFRQQDVLEVNNLLHDIRKWREAGMLDIVNIALRRFHSAYHGPIEDRMIDQMIAFESLYLGDPQELTFKLALRVAFLLGKRQDKRRAIFNDMKKAYSYRSRIVHGDNPPSRDELRDIVPKTEDYLRQSIRRFLLLLSQGMLIKEIRDKLDENILKNGKILALRE